MYAPALMARLPAGTQLNGVFEVEAHIASGGMGEIYRGRAIETGDVVAIKVMRTDLADNAMALALFRKEASALHYIHHDAIVRYYIFSLDPGIGRHYLAMEFVDGRPLSEVIKSGALSFKDVCLLQERLASGLDAAHRHGIIHRDLSPDNILIADDDISRAKIIDFGIARSTRPDSSTIIGSGFAGKYNYVSPEQLGLFGGEVTAKSDIYSLGLLLFECLNGKPLDMGGSQLDVIEKRRVVPDLTPIDARFSPLIAQMLQPDPNDRPESMAAVAAWRPTAAADRIMSQVQNRLRRGGESKRRQLRMVAAAAGLVAIGGAALGYYLSYEPFGDAPAEVASPAPVLNPDNGSDARLAEEARRVAADNQARQRAELASQPAVSAKPADPQLAAPDRPSSDPTDRIRQYVNSYDGGECFFVAPVAVADGNTMLEGYGASAAPFSVLDYDFKRIHRFEATVGFHAVAAPQCAALNFTARLRNQRGTPPNLDISAGNLKSSGYVTGSVSGFGSGNIDLLMIDHEGIVQSLTSLLRGSGDTRTFTLNLRRADAGPPKLQLVMAVTTASTLAALQPASSATTEVGPADRVFPAALTEGVRTGQPVNVRIRSFNLEK
ncbi:MAG: serine/threonine protein kinase [Tardiphaga sp.]|nr:serine/threonine protein kinase [Tardiphaga sp.]